MPRPFLSPLCALLAVCLGATAHAAAPLPDPLTTVTVQPGETAYAIARRAGISVETLLTLNNLSTPALRAGQVLRVRSVTVHVVQPGETLYALSRRYGLSVDALLYENALPPGTALKAGQRLLVPGQLSGTIASGTPVPGSAGGVTTRPAPPPALPGGVLGSPFLPALPAPDRPVLTPPSQLPGLSVAPPVPAGPAVVADWRSAALALLDTPYVYGGATRSGTDCSGLVVQVFAPLGVNLPRTSAAQALAGEAVASGEWLPGDLLFFDTQGQGQVSHVGIYLGDDTFIDANTFHGRVVIDRLLGDTYWATRYAGARRVLPEALATRPAP
ncbi:C40 family peptidase [uncultured Deinococcus sp.]|uniref:C40 family peptidase n=1 Tax=uncultured Deinococcus sp. TaxID=158789 RepID=UPI0025D3CD5C|nr:C40 family peptidase [uncultured Deinococcus sp.]